MSVKMRSMELLKPVRIASELIIALFAEEKKRTL